MRHKPLQLKRSLKSLPLFVSTLALVIFCSAPVRADGIFAEAEPNNTFATGNNIGSLTALIVVNGSRVGDSSADFFRVFLTAGQVVNFAVNSPGGPTFTNDPILAVFDPGGMQVALNDDFVGFDPRINNFVVTSSGLFGVAVSGFADFNFVGGGSSGWTYELLISTQSAPVPEPATMLLLGTGLAGVAAHVRKRRRARGLSEPA